MTVRDAQNHCLMSAKTFAEGGTFDAARLPDAERILALAAAAPAMLEALKAILADCQNSLDGDDTDPFTLFLAFRSACESAIAQAKGRTQ